MNIFEDILYYKKRFNSPKSTLYFLLSLIALYILIFIPSHIFLIGRTSVGLAFIAVLFAAWFFGSKVAIIFTITIFITNLGLSFFLDPSIMLNFQGLTGKNTMMAHVLMLIIGFIVGKLSELHCKLKLALGEIKELRSIIPICANCKNIRDDEGYWKKVETYIEELTDSHLSHGLCKPCADELYGDKDWYRKKFIDSN